ncbi:MAG: RNA polymerase sigma factor [candidate division Zixibacteria bacterium]|nr:RNA polymerase sigma factor [candidate division Zixibacteria bacterium]
MRMTIDKDRFWRLLEPEYSRAMMFCRKLINDRDKGDDLFQDALLIACTRIHDLREEAAFRPWLYRIIISTFRSTVRRPWWRRRVALTSEIENTLSTPDSTDSVTARRWLEKAFQVVSIEDRTLVTLHELEGWPVAELATLYGKSESAVKVQLFRARRKMKTVLLRQSRSSAGILNRKLITEAGN